MQLTSSSKSRLGAALALATANLFASTLANAQERPLPQLPIASPKSANDDTTTDVGMTRVDGAVLFYQEAGGRVRATEPTASVTLNDSRGDTLSVHMAADILTGATPNGAIPWTAPQTFTTPAHAPNTTATVTSASGNSTLVAIPGTGSVSRQYTTPANHLPLDYGFKDQRYAADADLGVQLTRDLAVSGGGGYSIERDYRSLSANVGASQDFNQKNTTVAAGLNAQFDRSKPYFGTPTPFTPMSGIPKGAPQDKTAITFLLGVTQVMNRYWLAELNYSVGHVSGYQNDPYRVISVIDPISGGPQEYLYENRPGSRLRQSLTLANKIALGPTVADVSVRGYHDDWGISSVTLEASDRISLLPWLYVEPQARYYNQSAATFFHDFLLGGAPLPAYATSDSRLGQFSATTYGLKIGIPYFSKSEFDFADTKELYLQFQAYQQNGRGHPSNTPAPLAAETFFSGVKATSVIVGYTYAFF
ncbi:MAG: DUF3570 domain-containing protein, partial [Phenylobacterium sp.]